MLPVSTVIVSPSATHDDTVSASPRTGKLALWVAKMNCWCDLIVLSFHKIAQGLSAAFLNGWITWPLHLLVAGEDELHCRETAYAIKTPSIKSVFYFVPSFISFFSPSKCNENASPQFVESAVFAKADAIDGKDDADVTGI